MAKFAIDYFELPAAEAAPSRDFFRKAFGWGHENYGPDYVEVREAGLLGGINADGADRSTAPLVGIRTDDIEAAAQAVVAAGGKITREVYQFPGGRRLFFREPGGNEMMIYSDDKA